MFISKSSFCEYVRDLRNKSKSKWNELSKNQMIDGFELFSPTTIYYSKKSDNYSYPDLGYFADNFDCIGKLKKPKEIIKTEPEKGSYFVYLMNAQGEPKYIYECDKAITLTGSIIGIIDKHTHFSFSLDTSNINYISLREEDDLELRMVKIEQKGERIESIIFDKCAQRYYLLKCDLFFDTLEEIELNPEKEIFTKRVFHKRLRSFDDIEKSIERSGLNMTNERIKLYVNQLLEGGFEYYEN